MFKSILKGILYLSLFVFLIGIGAVFSRFILPASEPETAPLIIYVQGQPTETIPPNTPLATVMPYVAVMTPTRTLKPPPTFEPPTPTPLPSATPTITPPPTVDQSVSVPGLHGLETPTPSTTPGCKPREDWKLTYTVQFDDALEKIATKYGTYAGVLAEGNCLRDKNLIRVGQVLRVPGETQPYVPEVACIPFELFTPINGAMTLEGDGMLSFNWKGPLAPKNLI